MSEWLRLALIAEMAAPAIPWSEIDAEWDILFHYGWLWPTRRMDRVQA